MRFIRYVFYTSVFCIVLASTSIAADTTSSPGAALEINSVDTLQETVDVTLVSPATLKKLYKSSKISKKDYILRCFEYYKTILGFVDGDTYYKNYRKFLRKVKSIKAYNLEMYYRDLHSMDLMLFERNSWDIKNGKKLVKTLKALKNRGYISSDNYDTELKYIHYRFETSYGQKVKNIKDLSNREVNRLYSYRLLSIETMLKVNFNNYYNDFIKKPKSVSNFNYSLKFLDRLKSITLVSDKDFYLYKYNILKERFDVIPYDKKIARQLTDILYALYQNDIITYDDYQKRFDKVTNIHTRERTIRKQKTTRIIVGILYAFAGAAQAYAQSQAYSNAYTPTTSTYANNYTSSSYNEQDCFRRCAGVLAQWLKRSS